MIYSGLVDFGERGILLMNRITRETVIGDILEVDEGAAKFFMDMGMHCLGCPASRGETVEQACDVHGVDVDKFLEEINEYFTIKQ